MGLQGQSTLTAAEKTTEAKRHVDYLEDRLEQMQDHERRFVESLMQSFERFGSKTFISTKQLFWLRDLNLKY